MTLHWHAMKFVMDCAAIRQFSLLCALALIGGCGGDKDEGKKSGGDKPAAEKPAEPEQPKKEQKKSGGSGFSLTGGVDKLSGWGRSVGSSVEDGVDSAGDTASAAADKASAAAAAIKGGVVGVAARAKERASAAKERVEALLKNELMGTYLTATVARFGQQLDRLADDPTRERTTLETATKFAIRQIPVLKQMDKYADARALYAAYADGTDDKSEKMRRDAKRQVLLLSIQTGLDVTMFGLPSVLDMPFEFADQIIDKAELAAKASKLLGKVPWVSLSWADLSAKDLDVLGPVLDRALDDEIVDRSATTLLTHQFSE